MVLRLVMVLFTLDHGIVAFLRIAISLQRSIWEFLIVAVHGMPCRVRAAIAHIHVVHVHRALFLRFLVLLWI